MAGNEETERIVKPEASPGGTVPGGDCGQKAANEAANEAADQDPDTVAAESEAADTGEGAGGSESDSGTEAGKDKEGTPDGPGTDKSEEIIRELKDKHLRLFAEFDNFRKRSEHEKSAMFEEGEKAVLLKILPLIDNFERALGTLTDDEKASPFAEGIEKTYKAFTDQLKELGVTPIEAVGKEFDANFHNAVMHVEDEDLGTNIVTEEFQKGYMFKDKVLRYSMVKVAN